MTAGTWNVSSAVIPETWILCPNRDRDIVNIIMES